MGLPSVSHTRRVVPAAILFFILTTPCFASAYVVSPVSLTLSTDTPAGVFRLVNQDSHGIRISIGAKTWTQEDGQNRQRDTTELIVSPQLADIPAGGTQLIRVGLRDIHAIARERSYRLLFQDLPQSGYGDPASARVWVDYSIPVFFVPEQPAGPQLEYRLRKTDASTLTLTIANNGDVHAKLVLAGLEHGAVESTPMDEVLFPEDLNTRHYVLSGSTIDVALRVRTHVSSGEILWLSLRTGATRQRFPLTVERGK